MRKSIGWQMGGFTLLEILVALIILSIGLLGLAGLQASGLRSNHSGYLRSQATILAYEMSDRMRANRSAAIAGNYNLAFSDSAPTGTDINNLDRNEWLTALDTSLPSGDGQINCTSSAICTIEIRWVDNRNLPTTDPNYYATFPMTTQL